jgi:hypothetical protein
MTLNNNKYHVKSKREFASDEIYCKREKIEISKKKNAEFNGHTWYNMRSCGTGDDRRVPEVEFTT